MSNKKTSLLIVVCLTTSACATKQATYGLFESPLYDEQAIDVATKPNSAKLPNSFRQVETPRQFAAQDLLSGPLSGKEYSIEENVRSNGRFATFSVKTVDGDYEVQGKQLMEKHRHELEALAVLREKNKAFAFAKGAGNAVVSPVKAVYHTVTSPIQTAGNVYDNAKGAYTSAKKGIGKAAHFVKTGGDMPDETAEREKDGFVSGFFGRPKVIRKLASELKIDPYTHFVPLSDELTELASYQAAGRFGIDQGLGFIPGVGGIVISGIKATDSVTRKTLLMAPSKMADVNRERLSGAVVSPNVANRLLLNQHFTPTEKTLYVGFAVQADTAESVTILIERAGRAQTRHQAFAALISAKILGRLGSKSYVQKIEENQGVLIAYQQSGRVNILLPYDYMSWTQANAELIWQITQNLKASGVTSKNIHFVLVGDLSEKSRRALQSQKWTIATNY